MNNFQHASQSDVLVDVPTPDDSELSPNPELELEHSPATSSRDQRAQSTAALGLGGDAVARELGRGVRVSVPPLGASPNLEFPQENRQEESGLSQQAGQEHLTGEMPEDSFEAAFDADLFHDELDIEFEQELLSDGLAENSPAPDIFDAELFEAVLQDSSDVAVSSIASPKDPDTSSSTAGQKAAASQEAAAEALASPESASADSAAAASELRTAEAGLPQLDTEAIQAEYEVETYGEQDGGLDDSKMGAPEFEAPEFEAPEFEATDSGLGYGSEDAEADPAETSGPVDTVGEVMEVEVIDSEEQDRSYEVYQQGSLTYFRYYLDDEEDTGAYEHDAPISPKPFLSAGAMGVGVLAATFGIGLLVAETTNRSTETANTRDGAEQRQADGSEAISAPIQDSAASPESIQPAFSPEAKTLAAKMEGKDKSETEPTETLASAAASLSGAASALPSSSGAGQPGSGASAESLARVSAAAAPLIPPPSLPADYQVVPMTPLPPVNLAQVSPASQLVQPAAAPSVEQQRLAARVEALRQANSSAAPLASAPVASSIDTASVPPSGTGQTYVTDPIQAMTPVPESSYRPIYPSANPPTVQPLSSAAAQNISVATGTPSAAAVPSLQAPPANGVSADVIQRAEEQKRRLNQAIAQPVAGLLVVPVASDILEEQQSRLPLNIEPAAEFSSDLPPQPDRLPQDIEQEMVPSEPRQVSLEMRSLENAGLQKTGGEQPAIASAFFTSNDSPTGTSPTGTSPTGTSPTGTSPTGNEISAEPLSTVASLSQLLTLAQRPDVPTLQPIASTVVEAVRETDRLEQFRILALNSSDYEQLWRLSAQAEQRLSVPAHGFVDYQRNVIAIVEAASMAAQPERQLGARREQVQQIAQALTPIAGELK